MECDNRVVATRNDAVIADENSLGRSRHRRPQINAD